MRTIYCNDAELSKKLVVPKTGIADEANIVILRITEKVTAEELMDYYALASKFERSCWISIDAPERFKRKVEFLFESTRAELMQSVEHIEMALMVDIQEFTNYSVDDFVMETAANHGIDSGAATYLVPVIKRNLKSHSVYVVVMAMLGMMRAGESNFTKFDEHVKYFLEVFKKAGNADDVFKDKGSHCLSVLAADGVKYDTNWEHYERFTLSILLCPYELDDKLDDRVNMVIRTIKC